MIVTLLLAVVSWEDPDVNAINRLPGVGTNDTVKRYRYAKHKLGRTNSGRSYIVKKSTYD